MTYRHYILKNGLKDSKKTYREYLEKHMPLMQYMSEKMKEQQVEKTFVYRFAVQF